MFGRRLPPRARTLLTNVFKFILTVGGFWMLLTHEVSTWNQSPDGLFFAPIEGDVPSLTVDNVQLAPAERLEDLQAHPGYFVDRQRQFLYVRLDGNVNPVHHHVEAVGQSEFGHIPIAQAIGRYIRRVDPGPFILWSLIAMMIKFFGVLSSCFGWQLLLRGQGLVFPFWQQGVTSFLIGRFIGTFLPSTIGLDAYTAYEAGKYSQQWHRVVLAKVLEKFMGIAGLFSGLLLTLPAGYVVLHGVAGERAGLLTIAIGAVSAAWTLMVLGVLVWPGPRLLRWMLKKFGAILPQRVLRPIERITEAATAYEGRIGLLLGVLLAKFSTHFTTAIVYFFTALAIGVVDVEFLPVVFGSLIQILGTLFSPTMAGEGAREALQALLLSNHLGGAAQAVLSAALGFVAAEAATLWGGAFLWTRKPGWRPSFVLVDGQQVDYSWIDDTETGFNAGKIANEMKNAH